MFFSLKFLSVHFVVVLLYNERKKIVKLKTRVDFPKIISSNGAGFDARQYTSFRSLASPVLFFLFCAPAFHL